MLEREIACVAAIGAVFRRAVEEDESVSGELHDAHGSARTCFTGGLRAHSVRARWVGSCRLAARCPPATSGIANASTGQGKANTDATNHPIVRCTTFETIPEKSLCKAQVKQEQTRPEQNPSA
jgi:hypothetical protein